MKPVCLVYAKLYAKRPLPSRLVENRSSLRGRLHTDDANILDIGCGHSQELLDLLLYNKSYRFTAVDLDEAPLELLKADLLKLGPGQASRVEMLQREFPKDYLNYEAYWKFRLN